MNLKKEKGQGLVHDIKTRVNEAHFQRLQQQLNATHYRTMSEMLREMICNERIDIVTVDESLDVVMERLLEVKKELNAIGVNLNQLTRLFNMARASADQTEALDSVAGIISQLGGKMDQVLELISGLAKRWLQE